MHEQLLFDGDTTECSKWVGAGRSLLKKAVKAGVPVMVMDITPDVRIRVQVVGKIGKIFISAGGEESFVFVILPASDDAPNGWGAPFVDDQGNPINPPLGTVGGTDPEGAVGGKAGKWKFKRNAGLIGGNIDWKGALGTITWEGGPDRYGVVPFGDNQYSRGYSNKVYQKGEQVAETDGNYKILGASLFERVTQEGVSQAWIAVIVKDPFQSKYYVRIKLHNNSLVTTSSPDPTVTDGWLQIGEIAIDNGNNNYNSYGLQATWCFDSTGLKATCVQIYNLADGYGWLPTVLEVTINNDNTITLTAHPQYREDILSERFEEFDLEMINHQNHYPTGVFPECDSGNSGQWIWNENVSGPTYTYSDLFTNIFPFCSDYKNDQLTVFNVTISRSYVTNETVTDELSGTWQVCQDGIPLYKSGSGYKEWSKQLQQNWNETVTLKINSNILRQVTSTKVSTATYTRRMDYTAAFPPGVLLIGDMYTTEETSSVTYNSTTYAISDLDLRYNHYLLHEFTKSGSLTSGVENHQGYTGNPKRWQVNTFLNQTFHITDSFLSKLYLGGIETASFSHAPNYLNSSAPYSFVGALEGAFDVGLLSIRPEWWREYTAEVHVDKANVTRFNEFGYSLNGPHGDRSIAGYSLCYFGYIEQMDDGFVNAYFLGERKPIYAVDSNGNVVISFTYYTWGSAANARPISSIGRTQNYYNFLTQGNLDTLTAITGNNKRYYPVYLIE